MSGFLSKIQSLKAVGSWGIFFLYAPLLVILYFSTFSHLVPFAWRRDEFSYCFFIPVVFLYLIFDKKEVFNSVPSKPSWEGLWFIGTSIVLYWLGELGGEYFSQYMSFWLLIIGICWSHWGWQKVKVVIFPLFFLLTMFPLPDFIFVNFSAKLQLLASQVGAFFLQLFGFSVFREGNVIDLGYTQLQVVDACSGLRFLNSLVVLGLLVAYFSRMALWKKITLVISTAPIAVVTNSFRISMVAILYKYFGARVAEGFFHDFTGWVVFVIAITILLIEVWVIEKIFPEKITAREEQLALKVSLAKQKLSEVKITSAILKEQLQGIITQPHFLLIAGLLVMTILLSNGVEFREKIPISKPFASFPDKIGDWSGVREKLSRGYLNSLDLSDYLLIDYKDTTSKNINLYVAYYESQRKGEAIHSPETCLPGGGWVYKKLRPAEIRLPDINKSIKMNRVLIQKGNVRQLTYFCFSLQGRTLLNAYQLKFFTFLGALTQQRTDGALVRMITPVYDSETIGEADERLRGFIFKVEPILLQFLPQT